MTIRECLVEARICLERSQSADVNPVVAQVMLRKANRCIERAEVMLDIKVESMPEPFLNAVIMQREHGRTKTPITIMKFPEMSRTDFLVWKKQQQEKEK